MSDNGNACHVSWQIKLFVCNAPVQMYTITRRAGDVNIYQGGFRVVTDVLRLTCVCVGKPVNTLRLLLRSACKGLHSDLMVSLICCVPSYLGVDSDSCINLFPSHAQNEAQIQLHQMACSKQASYRTICGCSMPCQL